MKKTKKILLITLMLLIAMIAIPKTCTASQPAIRRGTTSKFAILSGTTITNTGNTTINGDIGLHPGTGFTGQSSVTINGVVYLADSVANTAKNNLVTAYNDVSSRTNVNRISSELGNKTILPGTYDSTDGTFEITGTLTLDAKNNPNAVFVFKTSSTLITASDSKINLINGANVCQIFWQVGSSATLGTNSHFMGSIYALSSITANTGATISGQLLARNGAVTLDGNTITNIVCKDIPKTDVPVTGNGDTPKADAPENGVRKTINGGQLPETGISLYPIIIGGFTLIIVGTTIMVKRKEEKQS